MADRCIDCEEPLLLKEIKQNIERHGSNKSEWLCEECYKLISHMEAL